MKKNYAMLAGLLLLGMLTAASCGETAEPKDTKAPDSQKTETEGTPAATETEKKEPDFLDAYGDVDFGGATYTFAAFSSDYYPNYIGGETTGDPVNDVQHERDNNLENRYNVDIVYIPYEDDLIIEDIRKSYQAGQEDFDCVESTMVQTVTTLSKEGVFANLYDIDQLDLTSPWWSQNMLKEYTVNDCIYAITGPMAFSYYYAPRVIAFNMRLANDHDLPDFYSVVESGKWTLDYMGNIMKDFSRDLDNDGVMGEDDLWAASVDNYSAGGFYISAGGTQTAFDSDGKPYFTIGSDKNVAILDKVASIIGNPNMTQRAEELSNRTGTWDIRQKVYTFKNGNALFFGYGTQGIALYLRDMDDDYGIIPVPKFDESQENYITYGSAFVPAYISVPVTNSKGEMNGILLDSMGYLSLRDVQPLISDVMLKGKAARDEASIRMIDLIFKDVYLDLNSSYDFCNSCTLIRSICMGTQDNFASEWEKISARSEKSLNRFYEQCMGEN